MFKALKHFCDVIFCWTVEKKWDKHKLTETQQKREKEKSSAGSPNLTGNYQLSRENCTDN